MEERKVNLDNFDIEGKVPVDSILYVKPEKALTSLEEALAELKGLELEMLNENQIDNAMRICNFLEPFLEKEELKEKKEFWEPACEAAESFLAMLIEDTKTDSPLLNYNVAQALIALCGHKVFLAFYKNEGGGSISKVEFLKQEMIDARNRFLKKIEAEIEKNKREMKQARRNRREKRDKGRLEQLKGKQKEVKNEKVEYDPLDNELVY